MYALMKQLGDESREADGWVVTGRSKDGKPSSWSRDKSQIIRIRTNGDRNVTRSPSCSAPHGVER
jgi:hypothetical protein